MAGAGVVERAVRISESAERRKKITGIAIYESQVERLFDGPRDMADAVRSHAKIMGEIGGIDGLAERYWVAERV